MLEICWQNIESFCRTSVRVSLYLYLQIWTALTDLHIKQNSTNITKSGDVSLTSVLEAHHFISLRNTTYVLRDFRDCSKFPWATIALFTEVWSWQHTTTPTPIHSKALESLCWVLTLFIPYSWHFRFKSLMEKRPVCLMVLIVFIISTNGCRNNALK
jgi:hypothetical protein